MAGPGLDDANIGAPASEQQIDSQQLVDQLEGAGPDEPEVYRFRNRIFRELDPYPS